MDYRHSASGWSRIHQEKRLGPWSPALAFFSALYSAGVSLRLRAYRAGIFKKKSLSGFVVSIGNLTSGGTGKTPAVMMLASWARTRGYRVAVLSRGYGGQYKGKVLEVSDLDGLKTDAREAGDEPYLLAKNLPGVPVILSGRRFLAGKFAREKFGTEFFILDDGFQHLELERDLDLVLIDARRPFGNGHLLPRGPLREPLDQLRRADALIVTRFVEKEAPVTGEPGFLKDKFPGTPIFYADHHPEKLVFPHSNEIHEPGFLTGKRVMAFSGIARPELFEETLIELGADLAFHKAFADHFPISSSDIQSLLAIKKRTGAEYILTTEKDWVRIASSVPFCPELGFLRIRFSILTSRDEFFMMITRRADRELNSLDGGHL
jgi:tetraacyldisaccharide 4'-kinase